MKRQSEATKGIVEIFRSSINELYLSVYNAVYQALMKESAKAFSEGWTEAMAYMYAHREATISECSQAKDSELKNRYSHFND